MDEFTSMLAFTKQAEALSKELGERRVARLLLDFLILMEVTDTGNWRHTLAQLRDHM